MPPLEEITYDAGRDALADQESVVAGIRQRTGTVLAAQALVASFLGALTISEHGLTVWAWVALAVLIASLTMAVVLLSPWRLRFAVDADDLYRSLYEQAAAEARDGTVGWLAAARFGYQEIHASNAPRVRRMNVISEILAGLTVIQTLFWLMAMAVD